MSLRIKVNDYNFSRSIPKIAQVFGSESVNDCEEYSFTFNNAYGNGTIRGTNFSQGVSVMMYDMVLQKDLILDHQLGRRHPIAFIYVQEGQISLSESDIEESATVHKNGSSIYVPRGESDYQFHFPKNIPIKIIYVNVIRFLFLSKIECDLDTMPERLQEMFRDTTGEKKFFFETSSEPFTVNVLSELFRNKQSGLERKMLIESKSLELMTSLLKRFRVEKSAHAAGYKFSNYDIQRLNLAKNTLIENIDRVPTVKELAYKVGINVNKLQKGFQLIFNKSIRQFIISYRMHLALEYLQQGDYTITEIAHKIGYTNKGHFSQLFRKEFGILPSSYKTQIFTQEGTPMTIG